MATNLHTTENPSPGPRLPWNLLISFPRSGTDFFCSALQTNGNISYFREYFNPICNRRRETELSACFGDQRYDRRDNIMREFTASEVDRVLAVTWAKDAYNTTKENFCALQVEHLQKHFNMACLIRNMSHTFPTSRPDYIAPILVSFLKNGAYFSSFIAKQLNELRSFILSTQISGAGHICVMAYIIQHYILIAACRKFSIPIVSYEDLVTLGRAQLCEKLECMRTFGIDVERTVSVILDQRAPGGEEFLAGRRMRDRSMLEIPWLPRALQLLAELSPELTADLNQYLAPIR